jgi:hypothetical protein
MTFIGTNVHTCIVRATTRLFAVKLTMPPLPENITKTPVPVVGGAAQFRNRHLPNTRTREYLF